MIRFLLPLVFIAAVGRAADRPNGISKDYFDRETGERLKIKEQDYRRTPPGSDREASHVSHRVRVENALTS